MTNVERMCVRMFGPGMVVALAGAFIGILIDRLADSPIFASAFALWPWLPGIVVVGACSYALASFLVQACRLRRWEQGKAEHYCDCGCLLGSVREDGRFGPYRKCLGCESNRSTRYETQDLP